MTTVNIEKKLCSGAYGSIYSCRDKDNKEYVVKYVKDEKSGITCLMECIIMASIDYPFLQHAVSILPDSQGVYILQEKAIRDLETNNKGTEEEKRQMLFSIAQAVAVLHDCNIVHGDIKGSNCLLFKDGSVKLTDFSHSFKLLGKKEVNYTCGTITHQAPENVKEKICSKAFDIWSLACTFYEIMYGQHLFPNGCQDKMNALDCNKQVDKLISNMINTDRHKRIDIKEVLTSPYFIGLKRKNRYHIHISKEISKETLNLKDMSKEGQIIARKIERCVKSVDATTLKLLTYKLTCFNPIDLGKDGPQIIQEEKDICSQLNFRIPIII